MATNKDVVWQIVEAINKGNYDFFDHCFADNYVNHQPLDGDVNREGYKNLMRKYRTAFPDLNTKLDEVTEAGDRVLYRWTTRGTHKAPLQGLAPTDKKVTVRGITIAHFAQGKVIEEWTEWDALGLMRQLGALAPEARPSP